MPLLLVLGLLSACEPTDQHEPRGPGQIDAGHDASTPDASRIDAGAIGLDAAPGRVPDASVSDAAPAQVDRASVLLANRIAELKASRARWQQLKAASPGPYWYTEQNCHANSQNGFASTIQVEQSTSRVFEEHAIAKAECEAIVDRYTTRITFSGAIETMEQLYDVCEAQLGKGSALNFTFDARGVIKACWYRATENCLDSCGTGFYLRDWQFGTAAPTPDGGTRGDAGHPYDAGVRSDAGA